MKKQAKVLLISILALVAGMVLAGIGMLLNKGQGFYIDWTGAHNYNKDRRISEQVSLAAFDRIEVSGDAADIHLVESDQYGVNYNLSEERFTIERMEVQDGTLYVEVKHKSFLSFFNFDIFGAAVAEEVQILYPAGTAFENVNVKIGSGALLGGDVTATDADIRISSGRCDLKDWKGKTMQMGIVSGDAALTGLELSTLTTSVSSGTLRMEDIAAKEGISATSVSGDLYLSAAETAGLTLKVSSGTVRLDSTTADFLDGSIISGDFRGSDVQLGGIAYKLGSGTMKLEGELGGENKIHATSGDVTLTNSLSEQECGYQLSATSGSTQVNGKDSSGVVRENAPNQFDLSVASGTIRLSFAE